MSKFKVGDTIIRTQDVGDWLAVGQVCTVTKVDSTLRAIQVDVVGGWYYVGNFEYYVEQPAVLAPLKVFEHILAGTPLEYRVKASDHPDWYPLENCDYVNLTSTQLCDFRVKPQTVKVNGIDVPKPLSKLPSGGSVYAFSVAESKVYALHAEHVIGERYWSTEEDAQAVLDAILTSFSK